jgi:hypothetical protein
MKHAERNEEYIKALLDFIRREYNLSAVSFKPAKRGFYGETWQLITPANKYFIKLVYMTEHRSIYEQSFPIIEHLSHHGIDFISKVFKASDARLFTHFDGAVLGVFDWIEGKNIETNETKTHEFDMLARVYAVPSYGIQIPIESFSGDSVDTFFEQWKATNDTSILTLLEKKRAKLEYYAERLKYVADLCRCDTDNFFITHGDAGGNFLEGNNKNFIVDWDGVLLAPPERDAWVMGFCDWAQILFQEKLFQNGISYALRPERLAYYSYYMFFYWLTWLSRCSEPKEIESFFSTYGKERIEYADKRLCY